MWQYGDRWLAAGIDRAQVAIVDPFATPRDGVVQYASLAEWQAAGGTADWVMLGMKPQQLGDVADVLAPLATGGVHLMSILAGVSLSDLATRFPGAGAQVRILPNLAARIGAGVTAVATLGDADDAAIAALLDPLGQTVTLPDDSLALATATFGGATALLADSGDKPGVLIAQVASKGGTTQAGLDVLDSDGQLAALLTNVLRAARDRGRELADIARGEG